MSHVKFRDIGRELVRSWGRDWEGKREDLIKQMDSEQRMVCLLAEVVTELASVGQHLRGLRKDFLKSQLRQLRPGNPISDGMLQSKCVLMGDMPIDQLDASSLSMRARRALCGAGISLLSEVKADRLTGLNQCGKVTIKEILDWADTFRNGEAK